jgi:hypothetical protein
MPRIRTRLANYETSTIYRTRKSTGVTTSITRTSKTTDSIEDTLHSGPPYLAQDDLILFQIRDRPARVLLNWSSSVETYSGEAHLYTWFGGIQPSFAFDKTKAEQEALARVNRPQKVISLPLAIAELKDLPRTTLQLRDLLLRSITRGRKPKPGDLSGTYLGYQFGIAPLVSDVAKLLDLQLAMATTFDKLRRTYKKRRMKHKLSTVPYVGNRLLLSPYGAAGNYGKIPYAWSKITWVDARAWVTASVEPDGWDLNDLAQRCMSRREMLGLGKGANLALVLYNLVPWSFLVDYFTNLGDLISNQGGHLKWKVSRVCLMASLSVGARHIPANINGFSLRSEGRRTYSWKRRYRTILVPKLVFSPVLSSSQAVNFTALVNRRTL